MKKNNCLDGIFVYDESSVDGLPQIDFAVAELINGESSIESCINQIMSAHS